MNLVVKPQGEKGIGGKERKGKICKKKKIKLIWVQNFAQSTTRWVHTHAWSRSFYSQDILLLFYHWAFLRQDVISLCWPFQTTRTACLCDKQNSEDPRDSAWKASPANGSCIQPCPPSGSALYWQSRIAKPFVKVWDRTLWHSSHTTWMTHQITPHHILLFRAQFHSALEMISLHAGANVMLHLKLSEGEYTAYISKK